MLSKCSCGVFQIKLTLNLNLVLFRLQQKDLLCLSLRNAWKNVAYATVLLDQ